jgi:4-carboxymuconolactone decarboxylase
MTERDERQEYLNELVEKRGYALDYHKVLAEQDFDALKAFNGLIETVYLNERLLDRKTKELLFVLSLTMMRSEKAHIKSQSRQPSPPELRRVRSSKPSNSLCPRPE